MALSGEQWLETRFFPVIESLPAADETASASPASPLAAIAAIAAIRLVGAIDALVDTGVLDEQQQERCRAAMEPKGITSRQVSVQSVGFMTAFVASDKGEAEPPEVEEPDRLVRVVGDGGVFGLVDGEQAVLTCVEVWQRRVRACFLVATSPLLETERLERSRQLRDWFARRQAGEVTDGDRPAMSAAMTHPGAATTWLLAAGDSSTEGRVVAGQGGGEWWRMDVEWAFAVTADCREIVVSATEEGRVVGRSALQW